MKTLNGYKLARQLRKKRKEATLSAVDQALFYELVAVCNEKGWQKTFHIKGAELCLALQISDRTLNKCREKLASAGLITYQLNKNKHIGCIYSFEKMLQSTPGFSGTSPENTSGVSGESPEATSEKISGDVEFTPIYIKNKTIKQEGIPPPFAEDNLRFPFSSEEFLQIWDVLRHSPKWKKKTDYALQLSLDKLACYPEEFAIYQMKRAIESGWTGVVFIPGTDKQYEEWNRSKQNKYEENRKLSKTDKERLLLREYAAILSGEQKSLPDEEVLNF